MTADAQLAAAWGDTWALEKRPSPGMALVEMSAPTEHWVFGYGSLMWRPGFPYAERAAATLAGRRRAFCIYSVHHRGTPDRPGLVLGLLEGGAVDGAAYRVEAEAWPTVLAYVRDREQPTETYIEAVVEVRLRDGRKVAAVSYLSDMEHPQWAGDLGLEAQARLIAGAAGLSGPNHVYLKDLVDHLRQVGAPDPAMERLLDRTLELLDAS